MMRSLFVTLLIAPLLTACTTEVQPEAGGTPSPDTSQGASEEPEAAGPESTGTPDAVPTGAAALELLRANVAETAARQEVSVENMKVSHILVAFKGAQRSRATRSKEEAEQLAADLFARVVAGEDFAALMKEYSDDSGGGTYGMTMGTPPSAEYYPRGNMAGAFGDVGWRLEVGQVGVAAHDLQKSAFGWHIIKRIE